MRLVRALSDVANIVVSRSIDHSLFRFILRPALALEVARFGLPASQRDFGRGSPHKWLYACSLSYTHMPSHACAWCISAAKGDLTPSR